MRVEWKVALSRKMSVVSSFTPESRPPNTPAMHIGFSLSQIITSAAESLRSTPSRVTNGVPSSTVRTIMWLSFTWLRSKQWSGCPMPWSM